MITVDLEKDLLKANKKLTTPRELLEINEYNNYSKLVENDALTRIGLNKTIQHGRATQSRINLKKRQTEKFNQDRVFHISQIQQICDKYHLRFLPAYYYNGSIDDKLPEKISTFEIAYDEQCGQQTSYIMAPKDSFKLQEKPKDPLMFYLINDEYFYLIHKWGNDLNIFRRALKYLSNAFISSIIVSFIFTLPLLLIPSIGHVIYLVISGVAFFVLNVINSMAWRKDEQVRLVQLNDWNSTFE